MVWLIRGTNLVLLQSLTEKPDIIAITEFIPKKVSHQLQQSEFHLEGYNIFCDGLENSNRRGVLFYIATDIQVTVVDNPSALQECIFLLLKGRGVSSYQHQFLIGNIYRSPNSKQDNDNKLYKLLSCIQEKYNVPKLIVGDFNFSNIKWYEMNGFGASATCSNISDIELEFVNALHENFIISACYRTNKTTWFRYTTYVRFDYNIRQFYIRH